MRFVEKLTTLAAAAPYTMMRRAACNDLKHVCLGCGGVLLYSGLSIRVLARRLGRAPSTISRELRRNGGREAYCATQADQHAWDQACRPKPCKLTESRMLANMIASKLQLQWLPEQITGWIMQLFTRHAE